MNTFAINNLINESHKLKQCILFEKIFSGQMHLMPIIEAMQDELSIEMTYQSFWRDTPNPFEIYPYCIKVFKQGWYVIGYSSYKESIFISALDRIKRIHIRENNSSYPRILKEKLFLPTASGSSWEKKEKRKMF